MSEVYGRQIMPKAQEVSPKIIALANELEAQLVTLDANVITKKTKDEIQAAEQQRVDYIENDFLTNNCNRNTDLLHAVLLFSAKKRIGRAAHCLQDHLESDEVATACQSLNEDSTDEDIAKAFAALIDTKNNEYSYYEALDTLGEFAGKNGNFKYPYSLLPNDDPTVIALKSHMQNYGHDMENCGIGSFLISPFLAHTDTSRITNRDYFYKDKLEYLRLALLSVVQILTQDLDKNRKVETLDLNHILLTIRAALIKRLRGIRLTPSIDISFNLPEDPIFIEAANAPELTDLGYNFGKNPLLTMCEQLNPNDKGEVSFTAGEIDYQGDRYAALRIQDTAGGISPREMFAIKRRKLKILTKNGDAEAAQELSKLNKWRYRELKIEELYNYMFERNVSGKAVSDIRELQASGLGLDMAKRFLQNHRARIFVTDSTVESTDGSGGATFLILLPTKASNAGFADPLEPSKEDDPGGAEKALKDALAA